jgi:hypothetical protein
MEDLPAYSVHFFHQEKRLRDHEPVHPCNSEKCGWQGHLNDNSKKIEAPRPALDGLSRETKKVEFRADAWWLAARLAGGGTIAAGRPLGSALSRTWWPIAIPAAIAFPKLRRPVAALILAPPLLDWAGRRPPLDPARYVAARLLDDAAYSLGVWQGCLKRRTIRPLLPALGNRRQPTQSRSANSTS